MSTIQKYGIQEGQYYKRADGTGGHVKVIDARTYADCDDVIIEDESGNHQRIDAFKLAQVRFYLTE